MNTTSVVLAGVGGQGILLASELVAKAAMLSGFDVKTNEVHGMAQRGGSVLAQIRFGEKVHSPLVALGQADVFGALEAIEGLRYANYLKQGGLAVCSTQRIIPVTVSSRSAVYPDDVEARLAAVFPRLVLVDAAELALELGDLRVANLAVMGALSQGLDLLQEAWQEAIRSSLKASFLEMNLKAFELGRQAVKG